MADVEGEDPGSAPFEGRRHDAGVVDRSPGDPALRERPEESPGLPSGEGLRPAPAEVLAKETLGVRRGEPVRRRQAREDRVGFEEDVRGQDDVLRRGEEPLDDVARRRVPLAPRVPRRGRAVARAPMTITVLNARILACALQRAPLFGAAGGFRTSVGAGIQWSKRSGP